MTAPAWLLALERGLVRLGLRSALRLRGPQAERLVLRYVRWRSGGRRD